MSSQVTSSSDDLFREYNVSMPRFAMPDEVQPSSTAQQQPSYPKTSGGGGGGGLQNSRNPVIDRLMGKESAGIVPSNIRNESYYMATNQDTWNAAQLKQHMLQSAASRKENAPPPPPLECPTVHQRTGESLMIEQVSTERGHLQGVATGSRQGEG